MQVSTVDSYFLDKVKGEINVAITYFLLNSYLQLKRSTFFRRLWDKANCLRLFYLFCLRFCCCCCCCCLFFKGRGPSCFFWLSLEWGSLKQNKNTRINKVKKYTVKSGKKEKQTNKQIIWGNRNLHWRISLLFRIKLSFSLISDNFKEKNFEDQVGSIFPKLAFIAFKVLFHRYVEL